MPLLAVLPGTGGLTRLTDKRRVRRDLADVFCATEEGVRGQRAVQWRLVDEVVLPSAWEARIAERAMQLAERSDRPADAAGITLPGLQREFATDGVRYSHVRVAFDRRRPPRHDHPGRADCGPAGRCRRHSRGRRAILAAAAGARTGRRAAASALQRAGTRHCIVFRSEGDPRCRAGRRRAAGGASGRLAGARNPPLPEARAEARGHDLAQPDRADRAGRLLRRHAGGTGLCRRPRADVCRHARRRQCPAGQPASLGVEFRRLSDGQRP